MTTKSCPTCDGETGGWVDSQSPDDQYWEECNDCFGTGQIIVGQDTPGRKNGHNARATLWRAIQRRPGLSLRQLRHISREEGVVSEESLDRWSREQKRLEARGDIYAELPPGTSGPGGSPRIDRPLFVNPACTRYSDGGRNRYHVQPTKEST